MISLRNLCLIIASAIILTGLNACSRYSVSINKNLVYEPPGLFKDYSINDPVLRECVRSTIAELGLTKAEQLIQLICPPGNISAIDGLSVFTKLEVLGLSSQSIKNIDQLGALTTIRQLNLAHNDISDFSALAQLTNLEFLEARGNQKAACQTFKLAISTRTSLPAHCS